MRVAYLTNQYPKVSHTFIRREILALEGQGVEVARFALRGWDAEVPDPVDAAEREKTRHTLKAGLMALLLVAVKEAVKTPGAFWRALRAAFAMAKPSARPWPYHLIYLAHACQLRAWLREAPVDHLHAHFGTNPAEIAYLLRLLGGPPYSFTVHGPDEIDDSKRLGLDRTVGNAAFVAAISSYTKSQLMRRVPAEHWDRIKVVHCGLPKAAFEATPTPLPADPVLLCIGRLNEQKGHLVLLEAFAAIRDRHPKARLVLVGDGELRDLVEARLTALGIAQAVEITGWVGSDRVETELKAARIVVQPSFMEGLPVAIMEAMAARRPVISTYVAGIPELVRPGETGWLVPSGDAEGLAEAMDEALSASDERLAEITEAAYTRVRTRHSIETEAAKLAGYFLGPK